MLERLVPRARSGLGVAGRETDDGSVGGWEDSWDGVQAIAIVTMLRQSRSSAIGLDRDRNSRRLSVDPAICKYFMLDIVLKDKRGSHSFSGYPSHCLELRDRLDSGLLKHFHYLFSPSSSFVLYRVVLYRC